MTKDGAFVAALRDVLGDGAVVVDPAARAAMASDHSRIPGDCVAAVLPASEGEVLAALEIARRFRVTVVPRAAGTAVTGAATATAGQLVIDVSRMNRILDVDGRDLVAVVEPGVLTGDLHAAVEARGLFYPPDPASSAISTVGGNVATCAGGLRAVKYGVTRDYVLGIRAVLADGSVLDLGGRNHKSVVGYDLVRLLVGSEGTLAIFLRLTLKLLPKPASCETVLASFPDESAGLSAADAILAAGLLPRALEYLDRDVLAIVAGALGEDLPAFVRSRLLVEFDGARSAVAEDVDRALAVLRDLGATEARRASTARERDELWRARRFVSKAVLSIAPAKKSEDLGVPRSKLPGAIEEIKAAGAREGIRVLAYGHAGDANLHVNFLYDPASPGDVAALPRAIAAARKVALSRGGTISGEHGIGLTKLDAARDEIAGRALRLMHGIKRVFDPDGLLNPGKALPAERKD